MSEKFRLGKDCTFAVDGEILKGVREVGVRRITNEIDGTGFYHAMQSTIVLHRTFEIDVAVLKPTDVAVLQQAEAARQVVTVTTTNGLRPISANFVVCESTADESIDGAVVAMFVLKQWGHGRDE